MVLCMTGIGSGSAPLAQCVDLASRPGRAQQWRRCKHLIIDEISMVESTYFDKLEAVARAVRKISHLVQKCKFSLPFITWLFFFSWKL